METDLKNCVKRLSNFSNDIMKKLTEFTEEDQSLGLLAQIHIYNMFSKMLEAQNKANNNEQYRKKVDEGFKISELLIESATTLEYVKGKIKDGDN